MAIAGRQYLPGLPDRWRQERGSSSTRSAGGLDGRIIRVIRMCRNVVVPVVQHSSHRTALFVIPSLLSERTCIISNENPPRPSPSAVCHTLLARSHACLMSVHAFPLRPSAYMLLWLWIMVATALVHLTLSVPLVRSLTSASDVRPTFRRVSSGPTCRTSPAATGTRTHQRRRRYGRHRPSCL